MNMNEKNKVENCRIEPKLKLINMDSVEVEQIEWLLYPFIPYGSYTLHGDYYLPDLEINEEEPTYGKYGIMRKQFLKEHRSARYQYLVLTGKLTEHLNQVDKEAREKVEMLMKQMVEQWGVTEELKMQDQMEWVRRMNNIRSIVDNQIYMEIITK